MDTEQLRPEEMDRHVENGTFRLAFIGMSNAGKSYRSRVLQTECDFYWYEVDAHIQDALNIANMSDISSWLGFPNNDVYQDNADQYLAAEETCTHLSDLNTGGKNLVFDTTGSVIYLSRPVRDWLHDQCLVVNIDVDDDSLVTLAERYFAEPKPVIWGNSFDQLESEDIEQALRRCYPKLLSNRMEKYRQMAHISIPMKELKDTSGTDTLEIIKKYLAYQI